MSQKQQNQKPKLEITGSRQLTSWMFEQNVSICFTTYQTGKLFLIGLKQDGKLSIFERTFNRCMGLYSNPQTMYMSSLYQLWRFENAVPEGGDFKGYDRVYIPQMSWTTGDIDIHDIIMDTAGEPIFANTLFSCLAKPSSTHSFKPVWQPDFITKLAAEDRCHLNGLAMVDGQPKYVTAVGKSDAADGWRDHRKKGGIVIDAVTQEIITDQLSMPHSPRFYKGKLWLLNSGTGEFGYVDKVSGSFEPVAFCPGYLRGMAFSGKYALVSTSKSRDNKTFSGLELDERLNEKNIEPRCAIYVINLESGDTVHWLRMEGIVKELYDVTVLEGVRRPMAIGFKTDEIRRMLSMEE